MTTYLIYDDVYLEHDTGMHPENAERLRQTTSYLKESGTWDKLTHLKPRAATMEEIAYIHSPAYIKSVEFMTQKGGGYLDPDTVVSSRSYEAAVYAVGGVLTAIDAVMTPEYSVSGVMRPASNTRDTQYTTHNAFCLVRPPGHHARPNHGMGFCLFNNIAVGARYLQKKHHLTKVAIIDWDLHHGNGTQEAFWQDDTILYISLHRYPYYPGSGHADEIGMGKGKGFTLNKPLDDTTTREDYFANFTEAISAMKSFQPEFILISAGFDTYKFDPLGGLGLEVNDYAELTNKIKEVADKTCKGRIVSVLEGGYSLNGIPRCIETHLKALMD